MRLRSVGLLALLLIARTAAVGAEELNRVLGVRHSVSPERVRLVFETEKRPEFQVYPAGSGDQLVVDFIDTSADRLRRSAPPRTDLIRDWSFQAVNLSRTRCVLRLAYRLPLGQLSTSVLDSPHRLVLDIDPGYVHEDRFQLTPGVEWVRREEARPGHYLIWNQLALNLSDPALRVDVGLAKDRLDAREEPSSMVRRLGALAGINGGYFATSGGPLGVVVRDGKLLAPHVGRRPPRTTLGITADRKIQFEQVVARGKNLESRDGGSWNDIVVALGGGPRLLHRGKIAMTTDAEELGPKGNDITRVAARTAVATTRDGKMLLVTATGHRDNHSEGLKLEALANQLLRQGATEAMNLDGGASVAMAVGSNVVSDGPGSTTREKPVATCLLLFDERQAAYPAAIKLQPERVQLPADGKSKMSLGVQVLDSAGRPVADGTVVRFYPEKCLVIPWKARTKEGRVRVAVHSLRLAEQAEIRAECGPVAQEIALPQQLSAPSRLHHRLDAGTAAKNDPAHQQVRLTLQADDAFGNAVPGTPVELVTTGVESGPFETDPYGMLQLMLAVPREGGEVEVRCAGTPGLKVAVPALAPAPEPAATPAPAR